jgi:preprotein translocase subunit SecE
MAKTNLAQFVREVRQEAAKVTWPTRKETGITKGMVLLMVIVADVFILVVDQHLAYGIQFMMRVGG